MRKLLMMALCLMMAACGNGNKQTAENHPSAVAESKADITVIYLHKQNGCATCHAIQKILAEAQEGWAKEYVENGNVAFVDAAFGTPEGDLLSEKYEKASPALLVVEKESITDLTLVAFRDARIDPEGFVAELKSAINL